MVENAANQRIARHAEAAGVVRAELVNGSSDGLLGASDARKSSGVQLPGSRQAAGEASIDVTGEAAHRAQVRALERQREALQAEMARVTERLKDAEARAVIPRDRHEFDLTTEDWRQLAQEGTVKYRVPCARPEEWDLSAERLQRLGLAPEDAPILEEAFANSAGRLSGEVTQLCAQALGAEVEAAKQLGLSACIHAIVSHSADAREAMRWVGEVRAGLREVPASAEELSVATRLFLALTAAQQDFEADLSKSFGSDDAHRLAFAADLCSTEGTYLGAGSGH